VLVIPAIDIKGGRCVRLVQGDPARETVYSNDPAAMAKRFEEMGARLIHVVDLDGAFSGAPVNHDVILKIASSLSIPIEVGGGIRGAESLGLYRDAGIRRIIMGTAMAGETFRDLAAQYRDVIIAGVDARDSMVALEGWTKISGIPAVDFIKELKKIGIAEIIYTDISTDGMLSGPNYEAMASILREVPGVSLIASGGVSSVDDIRRLSGYESSGLKGCIVGKAIYDGRIDLREALAAFP
jgi:phosphoribosylformimino-5-aminoimidazole carboxamide ribotide isomerase